MGKSLVPRPVPAGERWRLTRGCSLKRHRIGAGEDCGKGTPAVLHTGDLAARASHPPRTRRGYGMLLSAMAAPSEEFSNQSPPFEDVDLFASDRPLQDAVRANGAAGEADALSIFGRRWGAAEMFAAGRQANERPPRLQQDNTVDFDPAYHRLMTESIAQGLHASTWRVDATPAAAPAQVVRAARFYVAAQVETGHLCPLTMTRAAVAALAAEPALAAEIMPKL